MWFLTAFTNNDLHIHICTESKIFDMSIYSKISLYNTAQSCFKCKPLSEMGSAEKNWFLK